VIGTVAGVDGSTLTVTSQDGTSYTVQTSNDTSVVIASNGTLSQGSLSDVETGDAVRVEGTVSGTTVTATEIHDGQLFPGGARGGLPGGTGAGAGTGGTGDTTT
jgi:riboflavin synthase alpha subunit